MNYDHVSFVVFLMVFLMKPAMISLILKLEFDENTIIFTYAVHRRHTFTVTELNNM